MVYGHGVSEKSYDRFSGSSVRVPYARLGSEAAVFVRDCCPPPNPWCEGGALLYLIRGP